MKDLNCDTDSGLCEIGPADDSPAERVIASGQPAILYFGDPMCSWCWGISPQLQQLRAWCTNACLPFRLVMGGLRAGGGDAWDARFRNFLRRHWQEVATMTGQTFDTGMLDRDFFEYDTEPACRAVVSARILGVADELEFFVEVQRGFYVGNDDPKRPDFYRPICARLGLEWQAFAATFEGSDSRTAVAADFDTTRRSGVTGFPTIALARDNQLDVLATGFATFEQMRGELDRKLKS